MKSVPEVLRAVAFLFAGLVVTGDARATDIERIAGRYVYDTYTWTMPNGQAGSFREFGATGATIDIKPDNSMVMTMHMRDGTDSVSQARILSFDLGKDGKGLLVVKWPDMALPVKQEIQMDGSTMTYLIRFGDPDDKDRYGATDRGVLKRVKQLKGSNTSGGSND
jgi:hypothetical protein